MMGNISPILTVIIFTYNHADYISQTIESVLEQITTYSYEIWVSDDCSTDNTLTICNYYAKKYPDKIKIFTQPVNTFSDPNKVKHHEIAIKRVSTKYFCLLDGDDSWCNNEKIQIALDILEKHPEYITFAHDTLYNDEVNDTRKSLVHEIHKLDLQNPVVFENAPYLHTSSRIHRNVVDFSDNTEALGDIYFFYIYLDQGPLYYYDKIMSIYNITGKGMWSSLSNTEEYNSWLVTQYKLNKYFNYKYDNFFTRTVKTKIGKKFVTLEVLKKMFGKKMGWEFWYRLNFKGIDPWQNTKMKVK